MIGLVKGKITSSKADIDVFQFSSDYTGQYSIESNGTTDLKVAIFKSSDISSYLSKETITTTEWNTLNND